MNEIERLFEKYSKLMDIGLGWEIPVIDNSNFRQAMSEALEKQRELTVQVVNDYFIKTRLPVRPLNAVIMDTKLEEQK